MWHAWGHPPVSPRQHQAGGRGGAVGRQRQRGTPGGARAAGGATAESGAGRAWGGTFAGMDEGRRRMEALLESLDVRCDPWVTAWARDTLAAGEDVLGFEFLLDALVDGEVAVRTNELDEIEALGEWYRTPRLTSGLKFLRLREIAG